MTIPQYIAGLGGKHYNLAIYIANRPPLKEYQALDHLRALEPGELHHIVSQCSNHWRKVFNVYAKFLLCLQSAQRDASRERAIPTPSHDRLISRWQDYRDSQLLQHDSREALLFSPPNFKQPNMVHIIAGKTYANQLDLDCSLEWLDNHFALNKRHRVIVCPYLDYRQLSNQRIEKLTELVLKL